MGETYQIVVVGGGVAGLVAACEAARAGVKVALLEAAPDLGGRARSRDRDGYVFNQGAHALYTTGAFRQALDRLGVSYSGRPAPVDGGLALWGDEADLSFGGLPTSRKALLRLKPLGLADRAELAGLYSRVLKGDRQAGGSTLRVFTQHLRPRVRRMLEALVRLSTYAHAAETIDAQAALDQLRLASAGVIYVDGGWSTLIEGLAQVARTAGVEIITGCDVERVERATEGWAIAATDGRRTTAQAAILTAPPQVCAALAPQSAVLARQAAAAIPVQAVTLDLGLTRAPDPDRRFALGIDQPLYYSIHSHSARLAPADGALMHAALYLAPGEAATGAHMARLERLFDQLQPGWRAVEAQRQRLLGLSVAQDYPRPGHTRAEVTVQDAPGLYLAGDWVGPTGMLSDAAAASGTEAALAAVGHLGEGTSRRHEPAEDRIRA